MTDYLTWVSNENARLNTY
jgi:hypothetical protein